MYSLYCNNAFVQLTAGVSSVLEFLQHKFSAGAAATTLRVYVVAIAGRRDSDDVPLGRQASRQVDTPLCMGPNA